jgi:hypothetical protein
MEVRAGTAAQVVEHLPRWWEALTSTKKKKKKKRKRNGDEVSITWTLKGPSSLEIKPQYHQKKKSTI